MNVSPADLLQALLFADLLPGGAPLVVTGAPGEWTALGRGAGTLLSACPLITIAVVRDGPYGGPLDGFDLIDAQADGSAARWCDAIAIAPHAANVLAQLLRAPGPTLLAESTAYSLLQSGPEHAAWLASRARRSIDDDATRVTSHDDGRVRVITLERPDRHNAIDNRMRHELSDALAAAEADPERAILLRGDGPSFSSGGDLEEFGGLEDPVHAHAVRMSRSPAVRLERLGHRAAAAVHGWCIGAGLELAAFASRIIASEDARFRLPEIGFGLLPGSGGTVSIRRRIGARRTLELAITGDEIDAPRALSWGLIDEIVAPDALAAAAQRAALALLP